MLDGKVIKGILYSINPENNSIAIRKYQCGNEKGEYKLVRW